MSGRMQRQIFWPTPASLRRIDQIRRGGRIANPGRAITPELLCPDLEYSYTVIEHKEWTSFRAGSDPTHHGPYDTLDEANAVLTSIYERLRHGTEVDGWSDGTWPDGRRWYKCDDWGHEESYELRIEATATRPRAVRIAPAVVAGSNSSHQIREDIFTTQSLRRALIKRIAASEKGIEAAVDRLIANPRTASELVQVLSSNAPTAVLDALVGSLVGSEVRVERVISQILDHEEAAELLRDEVLGSNSGREEAVRQILQILEYKGGWKKAVRQIFESDGVSEEAVRQILESDNGCEEAVRQILAREDQPQALRTELLGSDTGREAAVYGILEDRRQAPLFRSELLSADGGIEEAVHQLLSHPSQARHLRTEILEDVKEEYIAQKRQSWQVAYVADRKKRWQAEYIAAESAKWREECKTSMATELREQVRAELRNELRSENVGLEGTEGGEPVSAPSQPRRATAVASASAGSRPAGVVKRAATRRRK
ncbi:uncharacterized protein AB675_8760 [Cyphellophora attinorum]|uniref:Uncharacterized protein n=1 Tax=Cyphellophora attinorum TaxID=1664694 RepID=A0A0N1P2X7_9EURO|nr:uncharacterized protein AB675_8760 [Phialophora attinorum]KPI44602.1 hypothetical protein AB675_8760 [Phialophora attinorum]